MPSKRVDDAGILQRGEIDQRDEDQRLGITWWDRVIQLAIQLDLQWLSATSAFRMDGDCQTLFSKLPLHEGRRDRVDPSSREGL